MRKKLFFLVAMLLTLSLTVMAQVTTSGINGKVTAGGEEAIGATVTARHTPSGTVYNAVTNVEGRYSLMGLRAGGPYSVEISYIGFQPQTFTGIQLVLGQNSVIDAALQENSQVLKEVQVLSSGGQEYRKAIFRCSGITAFRIFVSTPGPFSAGSVRSSIARSFSSAITSGRSFSSLAVSSAAGTS